MHKHLSKTNKLLVISDTGMYMKDGLTYAFGPVVKEFESLLLEFDEITWMGFYKKKEIDNLSYILVKNPKIKIVLMKNHGGKKFIDKLKLIFAYPKMFILILRQVIVFENIHTRAPSSPAFIAMFLSLFYRKKIFWHKYAGSWIDKAPFFYKLQRLFLKHLGKNSFITINGNYSTKRTILPFENPCLDANDRSKGKNIISSKNVLNGVSFCFVGALNENKGVDKIMEAFILLKNHNKVDTIHIVGDGPRKNDCILAAKEMNFSVVFHGFLPKNELGPIYAVSHFLLLASKSEGFPKVIGEAMNYGCIPIVSNVSCIGDYVKDNENGFLIQPIHSEIIKDKMVQALNLGNENFQQWMFLNYNLAKKFTYTYYNERIANEIFN